MKSNLSARSWPRWVRGLVAEWERAVLGTLGVALLGALALGWLELGRGARGGARQTGEPGRFRELFRPGAFAFLEPADWPAPADNPFARPAVAERKAAAAGGSGQEAAADSGTGDHDAVTAAKDAQDDGAVPLPAGTRVAYHGCFRTGSGVALAYLTVHRAGDCTPAILPVSQAVAGGQLVRFSPAVAVLRVGTREYAISRAKPVDLP